MEEKYEICWIKKKDTLILESKQYEGQISLMPIVSQMLDRPDFRAMIVPYNAQDIERVRNTLTEKGWRFEDMDNNILIMKLNLTTLERKEIKNFIQREKHYKKSLKASENLAGSYLPLEPPQMKKVLSRILKIIDTLAEQDYFKKVDKSSLAERLAALARKHPEITSLTDDELAQRIEKIMAIEGLVGMLQDLTPEEMKSFDEAVKRRGFFQ
jgi:hypothetical protein